MVFSSTVFLFRFLPIFIILYFLVPGRMKNVILLLGSLFFYAWGEPVYVLLMLFSTVLDYVLGRCMEATGKKGFRGLFLSLSIVVNLSLLGFFKYADFFIETVNALLGTELPLLELPLPIGISFYTFQTMSYIIDCYRGKVKVQRNFLDFAVFVTCFAQLIAGPIVKYADVEKQLHERKPDILQISYGCKRFIVGLSKKVLLANNLGLLWVQISEANLSEVSVLGAWMGIIAFALQIYFDFSGYSDMAIGLGACLGFTFPENFNYPYVAVTITDFWRRWHMTLGSWFREYVYIPLGGNRKGMPRQLFHILLVWGLIGIWHGAGWNFLLWGCWFAFWLILEKLGLKRFFEKAPKILGRCYTLFVVLLSWVFFEMHSAEGISSYLQALFGSNGAGLYNSRALFIGLENMILLAVAVLAALPVWKGMETRLRMSRTGIGMASHRILEKLIPAVLLLASLVYLIDAA